MTDRQPESAVTLKDLFAIAGSKDHTETGEAPASAPALVDVVSVEVKDAKIEPKIMLDGILEQVSSLLDIEVPTLIASVWSKAKQLQEYRDPARHPPEESASVAMAEHTIQSRYHPSIELVINGISVDSLDIDVTVELAIDALVLEIQNARIMAIRPGGCTVSGQIVCRERAIAEMETSSVELPGRHSLGDGVEIPSLEGIVEP